MAGSYRNGKDRMERDSSVTGIVLTVAVHLCILGAGLSGGLTYIYPPPEEESILLDFSEDIESPVIREMSGEEPRAVKPDPQREVELVQRSEGQVEGHKANEAMEATTEVNRMVGEIMGRVILKNVRIFDVLSSSAAS